MQSIGAASAATLGYIVGNLPGAYYGYNAYRAMAPITRRNTAATKIQSAFRGFLARKKMGIKGRDYMKKVVANKKKLGSIVTQHRDFASQYVRRRMPRYKKRAWKSFVRKTTAVELKNAATKTVIFNNKIVSTSTAGNQQYLSFCLYGINGNADNTTLTVGYQDMLKVFDNEPSVKQEAVGSPAVYYPSNGKLHFNTGVLDFTLRNLSSETDAEVDVYYGYHWKDTFNTNLEQQGLSSLAYTFANTTSDAIKSGNTSVTLLQRGVTPFNCSQAISASGFKIIKKQKLCIEPGKSVFIQHRDSKNHIMNQNNLEGVGYGKKGLTYEVLIVHKPSVTSADTAVSTIGVGITRSYRYSVLANTTQAVSASNPVFDPAG